MFEFISNMFKKCDAEIEMEKDELENFDVELDNLGGKKYSIIVTVPSIKDVNVCIFTIIDKKTGTKYDGGEFKRLFTKKVQTDDELIKTLSEEELDKLTDPGSVAGKNVYTIVVHSIITGIDDVHILEDLMRDGNRTRNSAQARLSSIKKYMKYLNGFVPYPVTKGYLATKYFLGHSKGKKPDISNTTIHSVANTYKAMAELKCASNVVFK